MPCDENILSVPMEQSLLTAFIGLAQLAAATAASFGGSDGGASPRQLRHTTTLVLWYHYRRPFTSTLRSQR